MEHYSFLDPFASYEEKSVVKTAPLPYSKTMYLDRNGCPGACTIKLFTAVIFAIS
jgi:hypothetical protein